MLKNERFSKIINLLEEIGTVTTKEIGNYLNISEATVRRDINELERLGKLNKVYGGATTIDETSYYVEDIDLNNRYSLFPEEKNIIAKEASRYINDGDFVYLDAGTSVTAIIKYLDSNKSINYVTDSLTIAQKVSAMGLNVHIVPGSVKAKTDSVIGALTLNSLSKFNFSCGFFGTNGISLTSGLTTPDVEEAEVKTTALSRCKRKYILADISKIDKISGVTFSTVEKEMTLITYAKSLNEKKKLEKYKNKINIIVAKGE